MSLSDYTVRHIVASLCANDAAAELIAAVNTGSGGTSAVFSAATDATHLGFFGITATVRASAITQTYATAARTQANPTYAALTDNTGGTPAATFAAITAPAANATTSLTADMTAVKNALAQIAVSLAALNADVINVKQVLNSVVDDLQLYGLEA